MARHVLLVHESGVMRTIIRSAIDSYLSDMVVIEAKDGEEALEELAKKPCDLILSSWEMPKMDGVELFWQLHQDPQKKNVPFVLLTSRHDKQHLEQVKDTGIRDCLSTPFVHQDLVNLINKHCNPVSLRRNERYSIPGAKLAIRHGRYQCEAMLVNISLGGLLCDLAFADEFLFSVPVGITVSCPPEFEGLLVAGLYSSLVNLNVVAFGPDYRPEKIRVAYRFITIPDETMVVLEKALTMAAEFTKNVSK